MKSRNFTDPLLTIAAVTVTCLFTRDVMAQIGSSDAATIPNVAPTAAPVPGATVQLSYGISQIIQLSQAKVSDDTIVNYIRNSGSSYGMDASQIVYLKQQGVSDTVLNAMLNQPRLTTTTASTASPPAADSSTATVAAQPATTYVQTPPAYVPSSTVYVIPDTQSYQYAAWYDYYHPYYGYYPYYGGCYPAVTFSIGYGGGWRGGYNHGGWHGGGGWHH
jgi:hypothetical protein